MTGVCVACGRHGEIEAHHVAGRANHPSLTVPVCVGCHRWWLTVRQYAAGLVLDHQASRTEIDRVRALLVGVFDLAAAHALHTAPADTASGLGAAALWSQRGFCRLLDLADPDPDVRPPQPVISLTSPDPVGGGDVVASIAGVAVLLAPFAREVFGDAHPVTRVVAVAQRDPAALLPGLGVLFANPDRSATTAALLTDAVNQLRTAAGALLAAPDPATARPADFAPLIDAARAWLATVDRVAELLAECLPGENGAAA